MEHLESKYRQLLVAEESIAALDDALRLAHRVASGSSPGRNVIRLLDANPAEIAAKPTTSQRVDAVDWSLRVLSRNLKEYAANMPERQFSLLMDVLLLVLHYAYFALLPVAARRRTALLNAFGAFADNVPNPPNRFQIRGLVDLAKGDFQSATDAFRSALAATHADEHDFVTRVQMLWTVLMEHRRWSEAFSLLLDVLRRVPRQEIDEVEQLLLRTFAEAQRRQPHSKSA